MLRLAWDDLETGPRGSRWGTCIKWAKMHRMCMCITESQMGRDSDSLLGTRKSKSIDCSTRPLLISGAVVKLLRRAGLDLGILGVQTVGCELQVVKKVSNGLCRPLLSLCAAPRDVYLELLTGEVD